MTDSRTAGEWQNDQLALDDWDDHNPFADDWHDATWAGYTAAIQRGDGLVEHDYQSILLFLGMAPDELSQWRSSLIAQLTKHMRTKFEASAEAYRSTVERKAARAADKMNKKRNKKEAQTFDPLAGNLSGEMKNKKIKAKPLNKPKSGAKGANRRYANEVAKQNMDKLI